MPNSYEHSFQHNLDDVIDASDAVLAIGTEKVNTTILKDRSLNGNDATIHGAMPSNGYFICRQFTDANSNYLDCWNDSSLDITGNITLSVWIKPLSITGQHGLISGSAVLFRSYGLILRNLTNAMVGFMVNDGIIRKYITVGNIDTNKWNNITCTFDGTDLNVYINDVQYTESPVTGTEPLAFDGLKIGYSQWSAAPYYLDGILSQMLIYNNSLSRTEIKSLFNTPARLPLYLHNFERYPNSDTSLTSVFPYTSGIITSGSFNKTDGLKCTSAGQIIFSNSFEFDGSEYIILTIDGVEYSGTTTVTQGTITATIAQGSNDITIDMGTNDVLENVRVQFREEV